MENNKNSELCSLGMPPELAKRIPALNNEGYITSDLFVKAGGESAVLNSTRWRDLHISVREFGAKPSTEATTGSITSGSNILTVASTIDFAVGDGVAVKTAENSYFVANITEISDQSITLDQAASVSIINAIVQHDNTDAINNAFAYVVNDGGGVVYFPDGIYYANKPTADSTYKTGGFIVLKYPDITFTSPAICVELVGQSSGIVAYAEDQPTVPMGGVIIHCDLRDTSAGSSILFGQHRRSGADGVNPFTVNIKNINFRQSAGTSGPSLCAVNLSGCANATLKNVAIDTDQPNYLGPAPTITGVLGIDMPRSGNYGTLILDNVYVTGYNQGISVSEHLNLTNVFIQYCEAAFATVSGNYNNEFKNVLVQECNFVFLWVYGWTQVYGVINVEAASTTTGWWSFGGFVSSTDPTKILGNLTYTIGNYNGPAKIRNDCYPYLLFTSNAGDKSYPSTIAVGPSPFDYKPINAGTVVIKGGTVTKVAFWRQNTEVDLPVGDQQIVVGKHDEVIVTYTDAPTMTFIP